MAAFPNPSKYVDPNRTSKYLFVDEVPLYVKFSVTNKGYLRGFTYVRKTKNTYTLKGKANCALMSYYSQGRHAPSSLNRSRLTNLLRKDYLNMKPLFISRFAFSHLETCFGPKESWPTKYTGKNRPTAYKLRDSLRSKFSPLQSLPSNSRLRNHIMNSGANSRMNTIMDELASYTPPKRYISIELNSWELLNCCGATKSEFSGTTLTFLKEEKRAEDIEETLVKKLTEDYYAEINSGGSSTKGPRASGIFLFVPFWLHEKYGDVFCKAGFSLSIADDKHKTSGIYFKDITSRAQKSSSEKEGPYVLPSESDINKTVSDFSPVECTMNLHIQGYRGFNERALDGSQIEALRPSPNNRIEMFILRTRDLKTMSRVQIETHYANALAAGFKPMTPDGKPYLNGNYPHCHGPHRHWLMPMARLSSESK